MGQLRVMVGAATDQGRQRVEGSREFLLAHLARLDRRRQDREAEAAADATERERLIEALHRLGHGDAA